LQEKKKTNMRNYIDSFLAYMKYPDLKEKVIQHTASGIVLPPIWLKPGLIFLRFKSYWVMQVWILQKFISILTARRWQKLSIGYGQGYGQLYN
jgi:hypothetical protein